MSGPRAQAALVVPSYLEHAYPSTRPEDRTFVLDSLRQAYVAAWEADLPVRLMRERDGLEPGPRLYLVHQAAHRPGLGAAIGMLIGFTAGYRGGALDQQLQEALNMVANVVLVISTLAVPLIIATCLRVRGVVAEAVSIGLFSWPWVARAIRAQTLSLRTRDFVDLARLSAPAGPGSCSARSPPT